MKVCMLAYAFYETDNRIRRYAEALAQRGDEVDAVVLRREGQDAEEIVAGVHVHRIQKRIRNENGAFSYLRKLLAFFLKSAYVVTRLHLKARYSLIHVHSVPDFEVFATLVPKLMGARVILDIHDIVPEFYASKFGVGERSLIFRLLVLVEKLSAAYSNHVIVSNHLWYDKLIRRSVPALKCCAIMNYPDPSIFSRRPRPAPENGHFTMCYPGTLNHHQGVDVAVAAVAMLRDTAPNLRFRIIGDGPDRGMLQEMVRKFDLGGHVSFLGSIPLEQVADIMAGTDVGVVPKRRNFFGDEAFSTKTLEFMAMGVPVIVSQTRIDQHYFDDNLVQFFESGRPEDLARHILELMHDPDRRNSLRTHGLAFVERNNWKVRKHEYFEIVDRLLTQVLPISSGCGPI